MDPHEDTGGQPVSPPSAEAEPLAATILNVNDDESARYVTSRILRQAGWEVVEAATGEEALRRMDDPPDLVVLDVHLPDIDGFEVCRRIKTAPATRAVPVLHLSGRFTRSADRIQGLESGADGYLVQPVEPLELTATVRSLLRLRRSAARIEQLESELQALERLAALPATPVTAGVYGARPLRDTHPAHFASLVAEYARLLNEALEQREYRLAAPGSDARLSLGDRLGALRAGPRDVVDLHGAALRERTRAVPAPRAQAYLEEGRLLVLELMGHLVSYYRLHALGAAAPPARKAADLPAPQEPSP